MFGSANDRAIKKIQPFVSAVNALEPKIKKLSDDQLKGKTAEFRTKLDNGASLEDLKVEAFAVTREAAWRVLGMRPYDVQIIGGSILHDGKIGEMKTGEGKTLVATLPVYLNALSGRGVHVVTVNDYLARRDAEWMALFYRWMGLSTGVILNGLSDTERQEAYGSDITYGQNNEFGFDYLRDNMKFDLTRYVQRELNYCIIDEVDSILIDEARTPLIISGPAEDATEHYVRVDRMIPKLKKDIHYNVDEKSHSATLTEAGVEFVERALKVDNMYDPANIIVLHHVNNALKAHSLYRRDVNYLVQGGEVLIIDEHTGRLMPGRRWSDGLHQAVEAKEGVNIQPESHTLATISFQNYFRLYNKLAGMTGTAKTEEEEFQKTYSRDVIVIPTNKPVIREDVPDLVYRTERGKFRACVEEIRTSNAKGQPVLVGTTSVEKSEIIHRMLTKAGIDHEVLNAKHHQREATIVAQAGRLGRVTVATNMAGRGTDIILGGNAEYWGQNLIEDLGVAERYGVGWEFVEDFVKQIVIGHEDEARALREKHAVLADIPDDVIAQIASTRDTFSNEKVKVLSAGGLHILGTERHESRRIDNQLRGRAGRQGDPGSSHFFLSLEDDLMRIFANDRMAGIMDRLGMTDDQPIEATMVNRAIENAQRRVEAMHFDSRKNLLEYDDVMNQQRKSIYLWRRQILDSDPDDLKEIALDCIEDLAKNVVAIHCNEAIIPDKWDLDALRKDVLFQFNHEVDLSELPRSIKRYVDHIYFAVEGPYNGKIDEINAQQEGLMHRLEKDLFLRTIDELWKGHLQVMDQLRTGIGLVGYGQRDPKKEYQKEGFRLFKDLMIKIRSQVMGQIYRMQVRNEAEVEAAERAREDRLAEQQAQLDMIAAMHEAEMSAQAGEGPAPSRARQRRSAQQDALRAIAARGGDAPAAQAPAPASGPTPEDVLDAPVAQTPVRRARPKIGRNDPCWCGSGKKYKKCHMAEDEAIQG
jgi:preprotein translocase subunit SecA